MPEIKRSPTERFFGAALVAVGALIFCLCGLCTLGFVFAGFQPHSNISLSVIAMMVGGIPTAIGYGLIIAGLDLRRDRPAPEPKPPSAPPPG